MSAGGGDPEARLRGASWSLVIAESTHGRGGVSVLGLSMSKIVLIP